MSRSTPTRALACIALICIAAPRANAQEDGTPTIAKLPAETIAYHTKVMATLQPTVHRWLTDEISTARRARLTTRALDSVLRASITKRFAGQNLATMDVEAFVFLAFNLFVKEN